MKTPLFSYKLSIRAIPFLLVLLVFFLRLTPALNIYKNTPPEGYFQAPMGLRLNIDAPGVGTCAGDFPQHFILQSRCGQYYISRPGYSAILFLLSRPAVWVGRMLPEAFWLHLPIKRDVLPFAAALGVAIFLNILLAFGVLVGIKRLFSPYLPSESWVWFAQILYASAYGTSIHISDGIAEIFQQFLMLWIPIWFRDLNGWPRALILSFASTGKEVLCCFAGSLISESKAKRLSWNLLIIPVPLILWFLFLKYGEGVVFRKYYMVSDWDYGRWYLVAFTDFPLFLQRLSHVVSSFARSYLPAFLPMLWIGGLAYPFLWKRIPLLIHAQFFMALGQVFAMGFIDPRILYNFLFMPLLLSTVLFFRTVLSTLGTAELRSVKWLALGCGLLGVGCIFFLFDIY